MEDDEILDDHQIIISDLRKFPPLFSGFSAPATLATAPNAEYLARLQIDVDDSRLGVSVMDDTGRRALASVQIEIADGKLMAGVYVKRPENRSDNLKLRAREELVTLKKREQNY